MPQFSDYLALYGTLRRVHRDQAGVVISDYTDRQTITTVGKNWIVDVLQEIDSANDALKWHQSGIGTTAATAGDTALQTPIYSRTAGNQTEGGSANIYRSVATITYTGARSITEWGVFTTSAAGTLVSRRTFTAEAVTNGDTIQYTWDLTVG